MPHLLLETISTCKHATYEQFSFRRIQGGFQRDEMFAHDEMIMLSLRVCLAATVLRKAGMSAVGLFTFVCLHSPVVKLTHR